MSAEGPAGWLLLRGLGRDSRHWFEFSSTFSERLGVRVCPMDLPGVGRARYAQVPATVPAIARDVASRLDRVSLAPRFGVVAISLGGMVALSLAEQLPSRVERLVLVNTSSRLCSPLERIRGWSAVQLVRGFLTHNPEERERIFYSLTTNADAARVEAWASRAARFARQAPAPRRVLVRQLVAASRFRAPRVRAPTLVLSSRCDRLVSPTCSEALASFLEAPHQQHPSAGHDLPLEAPEWVTERVVDWLELNRAGE